MVNDDLFRSLEAKSKHAMWLDLADICTRHPAEVSHLHVEAILRAGIRKFTDEVLVFHCLHTCVNSATEPGLWIGPLNWAKVWASELGQSVLERNGSLAP